MDSVVAAVIGDIALVFVIASLLGTLARRCGQPAVIGQILAGIVLGPSLLGRLPGHLTSHLFPSVHPIFGAFLAGLTMRGRRQAPEADVLRAMDQAGSMLLPLFFVVTGLSRRDSATVAALVNTRGLTELITLNVGLTDGILNQRLFTVLVLMALVTTLATGPLLSVIKPVRAPQPADDQYVT